MADLIIEGIYNALDKLAKEIDELKARVEKLEWKPPTDAQLALINKKCMQHKRTFPNAVKKLSRKECSQLIEELIALDKNPNAPTPIYDKLMQKEAAPKQNRS